MARYSLIMKDQTYMVLFQEAAKHNKSLGKYLNEILNTKARELEGKKCLNPISMNPHCMTCMEYVKENSWCKLSCSEKRATDSCDNYHR